MNVYEVLAEKVSSALKAGGVESKVTHEEDMGVCIDGWLYITKEELDSDQGREAPRPFYELTMAVDVPGGYWQPADVDIVPLFESHRLQDVLVEACKVLVAHKLNQYFEHLAEEEYAKDCEKYTKEYVQAQLAI